jgi:hypothetical protein
VRRFRLLGVGALAALTLGSLPSAAHASLLGGLLPGPTSPATPAGPTGRTRIEMIVSTTSDWTVVNITGLSTIVSNVTSTTGDPTVTLGGLQVGVHGSGSSTVTVDAIVYDSGAASELTVVKGFDGTTTVQVIRDDASAVPVVTLGDSSETGNYSASVSIPSGSIVGEGLPDEHVDPRRLTLAFYYPWFNEGFFNSGVYWDKPTGPYATDDPAAVQSMVSQAASSGINGFVVSWDGTHDSEFDDVLAAADATGNFSVAPYLELSSIVSRVGTDPTHIAQTIEGAFTSASNPAFLHVGSRPVAFLFGSSAISAAAWKAVVALLAADQLDPFIVGDAMPSLGYGFDGFHIYDPNGITQPLLSDMDYNAEITDHLDHMVDSADPQLLWVATASPGENDLLHGGSLVQARDGTNWYNTTWETAVESNPDWVVITSWNEWYMATDIQPDTPNGSADLAVTKSWSTSFAG